MKTKILGSLLLFTIFASFSTTAALYRGVDAEGKVVYSDTPFEDAEKFTPPAISVMDAPKVTRDAEAALEEKPAEFKYMSFDITSPTEKQTIRNEPDVVVKLGLKPGLNTEEGHTIWVTVDGKPVVKKSQYLTLSLGRLERGGHQLQAQIKNKQGKIVVRTRTTTIFVHQTSAP